VYEVACTSDELTNTIKYRIIQNHISQKAANKTHHKKMSPSQSDFSVLLHLLGVISMQKADIQEAIK
jgi:hypothetical protein